jgi:hypothetical protein
MTNKRGPGFTTDISSDTQAARARLNPTRYDSAKQRERSLKSPWRNGPTVKSRNAHDAFAKCVAGNPRKPRSLGHTT